MAKYSTTQVISALEKAEISSKDARKIVLAVLKNAAFDPEDISLCTVALMDTLRMIPLQDTISTDEHGQLFLRGKLIKDTAVAKRIIEDAKAMQKNIARKIVREKIEYEATCIGMRKAKSIWDIIFGQAALWFAQEEDKTYAQIVKLGGNT